MGRVLPTVGVLVRVCVLHEVVLPGKRGAQLSACVRVVCLCGIILINIDIDDTSPDAGWYKKASRASR